MIGSTRTPTSKADPETIERIYAGVVGLLRGVGYDADQAFELKQLLRELVEDPPDVPSGMSQVDMIRVVAQALARKSRKKGEPQGE